ncbi:hypothetical protein [Hymenobacter terricola]|uniref:hypothetical protein n=1 Tax=Hymenobacter terricola TaxID=2819236 RepID=UPI001CF39E9D|nr:hypothetical protein [Hymenobacter terricola]
MENNLFILAAGPEAAVSTGTITQFEAVGRAACRRLGTLQRLFEQICNRNGPIGSVCQFFSGPRLAFKVLLSA